MQGETTQARDFFDERRSALERYRPLRADCFEIMGGLAPSLFRACDSFASSYEPVLDV